MSDLPFAMPLGLLAALVLLPIGVAWLLEARAQRRVSRTYGGDQLRIGRSRTLVTLRRALLVLAIISGAFALARPQWGTTKTAVQRQGIDVVVALDISRSMQAADIQPSRARAAAAGLAEMLRHLGGDRVGLVTFAGTAFARSPLTLDTEAIADLVTRAQRENALVGPGTDVGAAITTALRLLDVPDRASTRAIVLISDGEDLSNAQNDAVTAARNANVRIYTVAAGTEVGALVPAGEGAQPGAANVVSRADRATLARIASDTGASTRDVSTLAGLAVELARLQQSELDSNSQDVPIERFQWPLALAILALLAQTLIPEATAPRRLSEHTPNVPSPRRILGVGGLLLVLLLGACSGSAPYQKVHAANAEYLRGRFPQALALYATAKQLASTEPIVDYDIANTLLRLDRFDDAVSSAKSAATTTKDGTLYAQATYTAASAAFRRGNLVEARDGFITVLQRDPNDVDARHNLEVVLHAIQRTPPPATPTPTPPPSNGQGSGPSASPTPGGGQSQPGQGQPSGTPGAGAGQPSGQPGQPGSGQPGQGGGSATPGGTSADAQRAADEALRASLAGLPADLTPEQAMAVLDTARQASEAGTLQRGGGSGAPNPNDR
ncbi:MAG: VWA domain-containing protein [Chloroflexi bacterium]|nr:MAG: VWA domain-containing protein [Chloroflexota bacterium]